MELHPTFGVIFYFIGKFVYPIKQKALRAGCAPRGEEVDCFALHSGAQELQGILDFSEVLYEIFRCWRTGCYGRRDDA